MLISETASPPSPPFSLDIDTPSLSYWFLFLASIETAWVLIPGPMSGGTHILRWSRSPSFWLRPSVPSSSRLCIFENGRKSLQILRTAPTREFIENANSYTPNHRYSDEVGLG